MPGKLTSRNSRLVRYSAAVAAAFLGLLVRLALTAWFGPGLPTYITFYPAVMLMALLEGLGPGLVATAAAALMTDYWILPPSGFGIERPLDVVGQVFFLGMGLFMSVVAEFYRRARRKAAAYDKEVALRQSQNELRRTSEQRRLALEAAELGSWDYHFQTGDVFWDKRCREMWGIPQSDRIGYEAAIQRIHPEDRAAVDEAVKQALAGQSDGAFRREFRVIWPDGSEHWVASHGRVYFDGDGEQRRAVRFIGANREVTAEKQAEEALKRTEAALREGERQLREWTLELERRVAERTASLAETISDLEDFSHSITHDLRAPLRAIRSFAQILQEECLAGREPGAQEHIDRIITAAARMDKLIQDVLQYSRLARSELQLTSVDTEGLLRGIIETYPAFQPPQVEIQIAGPLPRVLGNEAALTQCFSNLLGNAIKFVAPGTPPRVRIWAEPVKAEARMPNAETAIAGHTQPAMRNPPSHLNSQPSTLNHFVRLWFADNGVGIPKEAQERIFRMFQRLDRSYDGTGVGLTVVRKAIEKMGGKVGLESSPGQGSRFWLELKADVQPGLSDETMP